MASGNIAANGATPFQFIDGDDVHLGVHNDFGGGSIALEQEINGNVYPVLNDGVAITFTVASDIRLQGSNGDKVRLNMSGATAPDVDFIFSGASLVR